MPGCAFEVEFAGGKLDEIRIAVMEGFYAVPRGGIEIGGVFFGRRDGQVIRMEDYRVIECEHRTGPSFLLSEKDLTGLGAAIAAGPGEPVGWFHSHTRSEIFLSAADLEIHNKFFPQPWQVALVLRPGNMQPLRAGYFFRTASGQMQPEKACREMIVEAGERTERKRLSQVVSVPAEKAAPAKPAAEVPVASHVPPTAVAAAAVASVAEPATVPQRPARSALFADEEAPQPKPSNARWIWIAVLFVLAALAVAAFLTRAVWRPHAAATPPLRLQASDVDGKLLLRWNPARVQDAQTGELTIDDGGKPLIVALDAVQMSRGFYVYPRKSDKTIVHMKAGETSDVTTFAGPLTPHRAHSGRSGTR